MFRIPIAVLLLCLATSATAAIKPRADERETSYLLSQMRTAGCKFVRNGVEYDGNSAAEHLATKASHLGDRIRSTDEWIELAGARSSQSGKPYVIRCPGQPDQESRDWLKQELDRYRAQ